MAGLATKKSEVAVAPSVDSNLMPSGLRIASIDSDDAAISTLAVMVKAGPIYENYNNLGISHAMRLSVGTGTRNASSFGIVRNVQQAGGTINVTGDREHMLYSLSCPRNMILDLFDFFNEIITSPAFKPWEISDQVSSRLALDVASLDLSTQTMELLHKAAYRDGLGNSLYSPSFMIGKHTSAHLADFHAKTHTVTRSVLLGHGIESREMNRFGNLLNFDKGHGLSQASKYHGGEERANSSGNLTCVAIAGESAASGDRKEAVAALLLKNILGSGSRVKYGGASGKLAKAVEKIEGQKAVSGLNCSYADSGLTGAFIMCESSIAGKVVPEVVAALRGLSISQEELTAAKKALSVEHSEAMHKPHSIVEALGVQAMNGGGDDIETLMTMVSASDVTAVAKKLANGKLSMAATGNLSNVPYLDTM